MNIFYRLAVVAAMHTLLYAADKPHPVDQIAISTPAEIKVAEGGSAQVTLEIKIPANHHVYLKHANKKGNAQLMRFSIPTETGFQLNETKRPRGVKLLDEFVLRDTGKFSFELLELGMHETGKRIEVPLKIRVQICEEGEVGICYLPEVIEKKLSVVIDGLIIQARDEPNTTIPWLTNYDAAVAEAKKRNLNIFALISEPSRCGACVQLEKKVLPVSTVAKMLSHEFIPYRVPKEERHRAPVTGRYGIPFYYIVSPAGENIQKWMGAPGVPQFEASIKPYAKQADAVVPVAPEGNKISLGQCTIELKKSYGYQAMQKGDFRGTGNLRLVKNQSSPGTYTLLQLDRSGEIDASFSARLDGQVLRVEKYLAGRDLPIACTAGALAGEIPEQGVVLNLN